jgi:hypothetical protein
MSDIKDQFSLENYQENPFFKSNKPIDFYDESRDDQFEEFDIFNDITVNILNKNIYENYKSYFYKYQDYNQINR